MKRILAYAVFAIFAVPSSLLALSSLTGSHSVKYDDDGTWLCWNADGDYRQDCIKLAPIVPASWVKEYRRGYIGCEDGHVVVKNITVESFLFRGPGAMVTVADDCADPAIDCGNDNCSFSTAIELRPKE